MDEEDEMVNESFDFSVDPLTKSSVQNADMMGSTFQQQLNQINQMLDYEPPSFGANVLLQDLYQRTDSLYRNDNSSSQLHHHTTSAAPKNQNWNEMLKQSSMNEKM